MRSIRHGCELLLVSAALRVALDPAPCSGQVNEYLPPDQVRMLPVVLVPYGQKPPTRLQRSTWVRHLKMSQRFFRERLQGRSTFELARDSPDVVRLKRPLAYYKSLKQGEAALHWTAELLEHYEVSRFRCPYTFCCLVMNPKERWPIGGGRTINGGVNRGGGLLVMSSFAIDRLPNVQSTLRHEIAHTAGLPHVDVYGYDMAKSHSVMSYNTRHRTNGFKDSATPAQLIPEDLRLLALADNVFPRLRFDRRTDLPRDYTLFPRVVTLGPMSIPGHPEYGPAFTTPSGEDNGSSVANLNRHEILPSRGPGVTFRARWMWASKKQPDRRVVLNLKFHSPVSLTGIRVHSGHSGKYNQAEGVRIEVKQKSQFQTVTERPLNNADATVLFGKVTAQEWRLTFNTGASRKLCLRGLQYYHEDQQLFPPPVPEDWRKTIGVEVPPFAMPE